MAAIMALGDAEKINASVAIQRCGLTSADARLKIRIFSMKLKINILDVDFNLLSSSNALI